MPQREREQYASRRRREEDDRPPVGQGLRLKVERKQVEVSLRSLDLQARVLRQLWEDNGKLVQLADDLLTDVEDLQQEVRRLKAGRRIGGLGHPPPAWRRRAPYGDGAAEEGEEEEEEAQEPEPETEEEAPQEEPELGDEPVPHLAPPQAPQRSPADLKSRAASFVDAALGSQGAFVPPPKTPAAAPPPATPAPPPPEGGPRRRGRRRTAEPA